MTVFEANCYVYGLPLSGTTNQFINRNTFKQTNIFVFINGKKYEKIFIGNFVFYRTADYDVLMSINIQQSHFILEQEMKNNLIKERFNQNKKASDCSEA